MNWRLLRNALVNQYHEQPQMVARIDRGLALVQEGLADLAALGHQFHLSRGPGPLPQEWPKLVFHLEKAPRGYFCLCHEDFQILGGTEGGWHDTLDEAKHSAGMDKQFTRGGVFPKSGLPAVVVGEASPLDKLRAQGLD